MCICINCRHATNCITYSLIEKQHKKKTLNKGNFSPNRTIININYIDHNEFEWDLKECLSFTERPGKWLQ
uniref:Ycf34 n=1 Tax=Gelidium elegans TaxID=37200 RepID=A0A141SDG2_GELEL|nr:hypothetical protein Gele_074 [Gelidium elegans]AMK96330.1 hypothetical protein Gele_074 [Gelidium elegans]